MDSSLSYIAIYAKGEKAYNFNARMKTSSGVFNKYIVFVQYTSVLTCPILLAPTRFHAILSICLRLDRVSSNDAHHIEQETHHIRWLSSSSLSNQWLSYVSVWSYAKVVFPCWKSKQSARRWEKRCEQLWPRKR